VELSGRALRSVCSRLLIVSLALACCGKKPEGTTASQGQPPGTIKEMAAGASVTTDVNARAPAFARADFSGALVRTQDAIGGKVLLLDFWSVFCQSCLREMPFLVELHRRYGPKGLVIVGVNTDFFPKERIIQFMRKTGLSLPYPLIHDRDQSLSKLFSVEALPVLVLIDSSGWIRMVHLGYKPDDEREIERRVSRACGSISETVVTLQPVGGTTAFSPPEQGRSLAPAGTPVGGFVALDAEGRDAPFALWRGGSPVVVFFWSLFCQPCREKFGWLERLASNPPLPGLKVLAVNVDSPRLRPQAARFLAAQGSAISGVFDRERAGGHYEVAGLFGVSSTPSTFLVGADGTVRAAWSGDVDEATLAAGIRFKLAAAGAGVKEARQ
jgi:thiol-disulfide isomerase/thioredoxin